MSREATLLVAHDEIVIIRPVTSFSYDPLTRAYVRQSGRPDDLGTGPATR
jgi:FMN-dependent NADH-azoreductase